MKEIKQLISYFEAHSMVIASEANSRLNSRMEIILKKDVSILITIT